MGSISTGRCTATGCCSSRAGVPWSSPVPGLRISVRELYLKSHVHSGSLTIISSPSSSLVTSEAFQPVKHQHVKVKDFYLKGGNLFDWRELEGRVCWLEHCIRVIQFLLDVDVKTHYIAEWVIPFSLPVKLLLTLSNIKTFRTGLVPV